MTTKAEHTPTDWEVVMTPNGDPWIKDRYNHIVHESSDKRFTHEEKLKIATLIVRAVNSHDALVEAVKFVVEEMRTKGYLGISSAEKCQAALKAAGEEI